jgi:hypothetical protein
MAINVTVLGASGATVTIPFTSATNAAAAQNALNTISDLVRSSVLTQYQYPGSGAVPSPTLLGGVVVSGSDNVDLGLLPGGTYSLVSDSTGTTTAVGAVNPMTVASGTGGIVFLNASAAAQIFVAGGTNLIGNGLAGSGMTIGVDGGDTHVDARMGAATINAYNDSAIQVWGGSGSAVVNALGDNLVNVIGANDGHAVSVFGGSMAPTLLGAPPPSDLQFIGSAESSTYLDPGNSNVTVAANSGNLTLVGGSGDALVFANHGLIDGGTGTNYLVSDSLAGATTLMSAGLNDTLIGTGAGNTYISSGTNATIADLSDPNSAGGATYNTDGGSATIYGSVAANSTFNLGAGTVLAYGQHGLDLSRGNIYTDAYDGANQITIGDFVVGQDVFSLSNSASGATLDSIQYYADADTSAFGAVGTQAVLSDGTKIDFLNFNVTNSSFT